MQRLLASPCRAHTSLSCRHDVDWGQPWSTFANPHPELSREPLPPRNRPEGHDRQSVRTDADTGWDLTIELEGAVSRCLPPDRTLLVWTPRMSYMSCGPQQPEPAHPPR